MERVTLAQCPNCHAVSRTDEHVHKAGCAIHHQAEERTAVWLDEVVAMVEEAWKVENVARDGAVRDGTERLEIGHAYGCAALENILAQLKGQA